MASHKRPRDSNHQELNRIFNSLLSWTVKEAKKHGIIGSLCG